MLADASQSSSRLTCDVRCSLSLGNPETTGIESRVILSIFSQFNRPAMRSGGV
ncbi:MAG: hypothetical protein J07HQW1_01883 [Haloquadratum walsbyi J07HQW1]|uniref:Uncharacterized protein n=1 Tax=Haloquadratum walsbyi J07HQW1 TaxID=1238424 RepID=U1MPJ0_9EURY|nr:MAG: hypothetical protein J07HQW1_01883 [Haloquadratum walsbyi J07HQW1]